MNIKPINRIKVVLVEKGKTSKWLAQELNKNISTVSRWCTNSVQPSTEMLVEISKILEVDVRHLLNSTKN
ncbi:helix-turn-helix transcriptional regulator [Chryseobacterium bernardetii]|uniref:helix-turn-helix transcriptional regulator n=1 Tax=Chryseobacterium bernardetii TaxID=1241978 RepID=UPI003AF8C30B